VTVSFAVEADVGIATIDDHATRNALTAQTVRELNRLLLRASAGLLGLVVSGKGAVFCSGADIRSLNEGSPSPEADSPLRLLQNVWRSEVPVVAGVEGLALGGGAELCLVCDAVVASEDAAFGFPELGLGVLPPVAALLLPEAVGRYRALAWIATRRRLTAANAEQIGFVTSVVPAGTAVERAATLVRDMAEGVGPSALRALRKLVRREPDWTLLGEAARSIDPAERTEGTAAFLEKRAPRFRGR